MENNNFKYVLFDLDGTLTNSESGISRCIKMALNKIGIENITDERIQEMIGPPFPVSMKLFYDMDDLNIKKMLKIYRAQYDIDGWNDNFVYDGIEDLLKYLKDKNIELAVATSKPIKYAVQILDHFELSQYFDYIGAAEADGISDRKSVVIEKVIENLNIQNRNEVLMIGDTKYDILGAKEAGVCSMGVLWGFGKKVELEETKADFIAENTIEVAKFFENY